jgi:hypothetical protein
LHFQNLFAVDPSSEELSIVSRDSRSCEEDNVFGFQVLWKEFLLLAGGSGNLVTNTKTKILCFGSLGSLTKISWIETGFCFAELFFPDSFGS